MLSNDAYKPERRPFVKASGQVSRAYFTPLDLLYHAVLTCIIATLVVTDLFIRAQGKL